jgi:hypothetical protein
MRMWGLEQLKPSGESGDLCNRLLQVLGLDGVFEIVFGAKGTEGGGWNIAGVAGVQVQ